MRKFTLMLAALLGGTSMALASCGTDTPVVDGKITKVSVSCSTKQIMVGKTTKATANVTAEGGASKTVTWSSSNTAVATVDSTGKITGKGVGKATITATSKADSTKSGSVEIVVVEAGWSAADKAMMEEYLGIVVPYFDGDFKWTDEYFEEFGCLTAESSKVSDLAKAVDGFEAADWLIEDYSDEDVEEYYAYYEYNGFEYVADMYAYGGIVSVDVYVDEIITEWPTEKIEAALEEQGFDVELPVFETEEGMRYWLTSKYDEESEMGAVDIQAYPDDEDSEITHLDYVNLFDETFTKVMDEYGDFEIIPADKSCSIYVWSLVDDEDEVIPGFEVIVAPYIFDYTIKASIENEFIVTTETTTVSVEKFGRDVPEDAVYTFTSSDETIATVDANGVVTTLKEGKVVISATYKDYTSSVTLYVKDVVPTEFTSEQLEVFRHIHDIDGISIPFNAHFQEVNWEEEDLFVSVVGETVGVESALAYYDTLVGDGWVDLYDEYGLYEFYQALYELYGYEMTIEEIIGEMMYQMIPFEKEIAVDSSNSVWIGADLYLDIESLDDTEGQLCVDVYDQYLYSYEAAKSTAEDILVELELESTATLPTTEIPASHYYVSESEGELDFIAYDSTAQLSDVKTALESSGFTLTEKTKDGDTYLTGSSLDDVLAITVYEDEGDIEIVIASNATGMTIDFSETTSTSGTFGDYTLATSKASGQSAPAYNSSKKELRLYANNTITFTSEKTIKTIFIDANTCGESKANGAIVSASTGTVTAVEGGFLWEGSANEVTLTVGGSGQVHINSIDINGGSESL